MIGKVSNTGISRHRMLDAMIYSWMEGIKRTGVEYPVYDGDVDCDEYEDWLVEKELKRPIQSFVDNRGKRFVVTLRLRENVLV